MANPNVGFATMQIVPSLRGIDKTVNSALQAPLALAGRNAGDQVSKEFSGRFSSGLSKVAVALPFVGIGAAAIASARTVEEAQNTIIRATGATGKAADGLLTSFQNVGRQTPASLQTVAAAIAEVSQRTGLTGRPLETLTRQVITFNRITKDSPLNVQDLTKTLAGFNVPATKMGETLDRLFVTSQKTGVPLNDLVQTLGAAGPVVRQFGIPIEQSAGLLATLNKAGVDAPGAIVGLRKAFVTFSKEGKNPQEALKGVIGQIGALTKAGDIAGARKLGVQIFGARGVGIVDAAVSGKLSLDALTKTFDSTGKGILKTGAATSTVAGKLGVLRNNAQLAAAQLGAPILDTLNAGLAFAVPLLSKVLNGFAALPGPVQKVAVGFVALGAAVPIISKTAGLVKTFGSNIATIGKTAATVGKGVVSGVKTLSQFASASKLAAAGTKVLAVAQGILNAVMDANPIVLVVAAVIAIGAAVFLAYKKFKPFRDVVDAAGRALVSVGQAIMGAVSAAFNWISQHWPLLLAILTGPVGLAAKFIIDHWQTVSAVTRTVFNAVKTIVTTVMAAVRFVITAELSAVTAVVSAFSTTWQAIWNAVSAAIQFAAAIVGSAVSAIVAFVTSIPGRIAGVVSTMWNGITSGISAARDFVGARVEEIVGFFIGIGGRISSLAAGMWDGISGAFKAAINTIIRGWNSLEFDIPGFSVGPISFGGFTLGVPDIPELAGGGVFMSPTLALLAERASARPEIVAPAPLLRSIVRDELQALRPTRQFAPTSTVIHVTAQSLDPRRSSQLVLEALQDVERKNGFVNLRTAKR